MSSTVPQALYRPRGYQLEMLDESLKANIIVTMDTGSGKTQIAILRIMAELDVCSPGQLIWFLVPTVELCHQQFYAITKQLPAVATKMFVGSDNTVGWTEQRLWDAALKNTRVVVSTHDILADALVAHAFVKWERLALLIFDEAHHCTRKHPYNRIMKQYHERAAGHHTVPHILGLTASPIKGSRLGELSVVEMNLNCISRTPRKSRVELLRYVHRPELVRLDYDSSSKSHDFDPDLPTLQSLPGASMTCLAAPQPLCLGHSPAHSVGQVRSLSLRSREFCREQLEKLGRAIDHVREELGLWSAEYLILACSEALGRLVAGDRDNSLGYVDEEKTYLLKVLSVIEPKNPLAERFFPGASALSQKVHVLITFLAQRYSEDFSGMIFVQRRATATILCEILSLHEQTRNIFRCAPYVGSSDCSRRKRGILELHDLRDQQSTLAGFREGRYNLIVTTDVLEEGIDVPICSLIVSFNKPANLRSFIQRRGRARHIQSVCAVMIAHDDASVNLEQWLELETEMIRIYQDNNRSVDRARQVEAVVEHVTDCILVESTGAMIDANAVLAHLYHFCATLPPEPYTDMRPSFTYREPQVNQIEATVTLPSSVHANVRRAISRNRWNTESAAMKDAALQCYRALYEAGLVNQNLLPFTVKQFADREQTKPLPKKIEIPERYNPWATSSSMFKPCHMFRRKVTLKSEGDAGYGEMVWFLFTPVQFPNPEPIRLHWDHRTVFTINFDQPGEFIEIGGSYLMLLQDFTHLVLRSTHSDRSDDANRDFMLLFSPVADESKLKELLVACTGRVSALDTYPQCPSDLHHGFVRTTSSAGTPYIFCEWQTNHHSDDASLSLADPVVRCVPLTRRRNFLLHGNSEEISKRQACSSQSQTSKAISIIGGESTFDRLPFAFAQFGLFIPAILQHAEILMVTDRLEHTICKDISFGDRQLVTTAISAPSAQLGSNYERLEFLGDSNLKLIVSIQLFMDHLNWHEGYLSQYRASLISNDCLCRAALELDLGQFLLTDPFGCRGQTIPFMSTLKDDVPQSRIVRGKLLADAVEALIGAAYCSGGFDAARKCVHCFLPEIRCTSLCFGIISESRQWHDKKDIPIGSLFLEESLIGHQFRDEILLREALNHPSCERDIRTESYQRLEFLGDAVLDMIVVANLFTQSSPQLSQGQMTEIKAALVNGNFLGYLCMSCSIEQKTITIEEDRQDHHHSMFHERPEQRTVWLWSIMRHHSSSITQAQARCLERYQGLSASIEIALNDGRKYPWSLLTELKADKFFSDLIESILGAIFLDTKGDLETCSVFLERIGLMAYMKRVVDMKIEVAHPTSFNDAVTDSCAKRALASVGK